MRAQLFLLIINGAAIGMNLTMLTMWFLFPLEGVPWLQVLLTCFHGYLISSAWGTIRRMVEEWTR